MKVNHDKTTVQDNAIKFHHTDQDFSKMIRAFIDTITSNIELISLHVCLFKLSNLYIELCKESIKLLFKQIDPVYYTDILL